VVVGVGYIFYGCGPEIGVNLEFPERNLLGPEGEFIKPRKDIDHFQFPSAPTGYCKKLFEIVKRVNQEIGERIYLGHSSYSIPSTVPCLINRMTSGRRYSR